MEPKLSAANADLIPAWAAKIKSKIRSGTLVEPSAITPLYPYTDIIGSAEALCEERMATAALIPLSWGEVIDKITILKIKQSKMQGTALSFVERELSALEAIAAPVLNG